MDVECEAILTGLNQQCQEVVSVSATPAIEMNIKVKEGYPDAQ